MGHIVDDPLYCLSATLDPSFKLKWRKKDEKDKVTAMIKLEIDKLMKCRTPRSEESSENKNNSVSNFQQKN